MEVMFIGKKVDSEDWVQGHLFRHWERDYILWGTINNTPHMIEVVSDTVGQYTGFTDEFGDKVFQGHILEFDGGLGENYWIEIDKNDEPPHNFTMEYIKKPHARGRGISDGLCMILEELPKRCRIIGNIYDMEE
jgi:hypothetical protein